MSIGHCMDQALSIARLPRDSWAAEIQKLPAACMHADCGQPRSCRERIADYLRVQYRMQASREASAQ